jgi:hypothetical protein
MTARSTSIWVRVSCSASIMTITSPAAAIKEMKVIRVLTRVSVKAMDIFRLRIF